MTKEGKAQRAEMDNATVKALLLMNGGGAIAVLTFLGTIVSEADMEALRASIVWGLLMFHAGLLAAVIHNHLRRRCSLAYETGRVEGDTGVCWWSWACLYSSMALFFLAGAVVGIGAVRVFGWVWW